MSLGAANAPRIGKALLSKSSFLSNTSNDQQIFVVNLSQNSVTTAAQTFSKIPKGQNPGDDGTVTRFGGSSSAITFNEGAAAADAQGRSVWRRCRFEGKHDSRGSVQRLSVSFSSVRLRDGIRGVGPHETSPELNPSVFYRSSLGVLPAHLGRDRTKTVQ